MVHGEAKNAGKLTVVKNGCPAVGGSAALQMGRTACGYNEAVRHFFC